VPLDNRLVVLAACNPYKLKTNSVGVTNAPGLAYSYGQSASANQHWTENIQNLVYAVHPLPETMKQLVWDFGSLSAADEAFYIARIVENSQVLTVDPKEVLFVQGKAENERLAKEAESNLRRMLIESIQKSQEFMRTRIYKESPDDPSGMVSLRDVIRTVQLFRWFLTNIKGRDQSKPSINSQGTNSTNILSEKDLKDLVRKSIALSLAFNYYFRLTNDKRSYYATEIDHILRPLSRHKSAALFSKYIEDEEAFWINKMKVPENTSKNQALLENVFVLVVCIYNAIPVFVRHSTSQTTEPICSPILFHSVQIVGKPGASKTLAMSIVKDTFAQPLLNLPPIRVISHQCSPQTTTYELLKTFESAQTLQNSSGEKLRVVVLLDEVGLAEYSPDLPLKMLHRQMENNDFATGRSNQGKGVSIVGISNWRLDPAKMNRAVRIISSMAYFDF